MIGFLKRLAFILLAIPAVALGVVIVLLTVISVAVLYLGGAFEWILTGDSDLIKWVNDSLSVMDDESSILFKPLTRLYRLLVCPYPSIEEDYVGTCNITVPEPGDLGHHRTTLK